MPKDHVLFRLLSPHWRFTLPLENAVLQGKNSGFPGSTEIFREGKLAHVVAIYIWAVSVAHSVDHYDYGLLDVRKVPMRLRVPPPTPGVKLGSLKALTTWIDNAKYRLAQIMFYETTTVTRLVDCDYEFDEPAMDSYTKAFFAELKELDQRMRDEDMCFMPLEKMANSVQY